MTRGIENQYSPRHLPRNLGTPFGAVTPHDYSEISSRSLPRANGSGSPGPAGNPTGPICAFRQTTHTCREFIQHIVAAGSLMRHLAKFHEFGT